MHDNELYEASLKLSQETDPELIAMHLRRIVNQEVKAEENRKNNAYHERNRLVVFLSSLYPSYLAQHPEGGEWDADWRTIVFVESPAGQMSWHIHDSERPLFSHLAESRTGAGSWDGHTSQLKYERLRVCGDQERLKNELLGYPGEEANA